MTFSENTVRLAWIRAGGRCECKRFCKEHFLRQCKKELVWDNRGREGDGAWEAHHKVSILNLGGDNLSNCEILCWECHKNTL